MPLTCCQLVASDRKPYQGLLSLARRGVSTATVHFLLSILVTSCNQLQLSPAAWFCSLLAGICITREQKKREKKKREKPVPCALLFPNSPVRSVARG
ncbi:hypothetical protein B296_00055244 [Ensete ventricosum]|uniref:Uncharacterized protein n=1 Tax=Ensete ventricosum TaxID=4639 RepID=A0A426XN52_ENSVE|nr:hypothetical protein B296_00055244 [Ensete ventricosum]